MAKSIDNLSSLGLNVPASAIRELANSAMGTDDLIPLWFGEPDVPTPQFICDGAHQSMQAGNTYYTEGLGKPFLREAIAHYMSGLYNNEINMDRIAITVSGTNAVNLAFQLLLNSGDKVVTMSPTFATLMRVPQLQYAQVETLALQPSNDGWRVDLGALIEKAKQAKVLLLNSPNNPTGFVLTREEIKHILEECRKSGTWIISDEVYARIIYDEKAAPSFAEIAQPEDRVIIVNSFSKSWAMTGWRLGWLTLPPSLLLNCEKLMEFSMSCAPEFVQAGGLAAINEGEDFLKSQLVRYQTGRDIVLDRLAKIDRVRCVPPHAAFYVYFQLDGIEDGAGFARQLAQEAKVGIAPGIAFERDAQDWFRICYAKDGAMLEEGMTRFENYL